MGFRHFALPLSLPSALLIPLSMYAPITLLAFFASSVCLYTSHTACLLSPSDFSILSLSSCGGGLGGGGGSQGLFGKKQRGVTYLPSRALGGEGRPTAVQILTFVDFNTAAQNQNEIRCPSLFFWKGLCSAENKWCRALHRGRRGQLGPCLQQSATVRTIAPSTCIAPVATTCQSASQLGPRVLVIQHQLQAVQRQNRSAECRLPSINRMLPPIILGYLLWTGKICS